MTLPVEFNASRRAVKLLADNNFLSQDEIPGVKKVLKAAALTYIAAAVSAIANLLRYLAILNDKNNHRN
jgi:Zn-dependent membrane protease YugP